MTSPIRHAPKQRTAETPRRWTVPAIAAVAVLAGAFWTIGRSQGADRPEAAPAQPASGKIALDRVRVAPSQTAALDVGAAGTRSFANVQPAIGIIDFDQDRSTAVFPAYQGRVAQVLVKAGDEVKAGQVLYTVAVPDIAQAASTLISTSGNLRSAGETLRRAKLLAQDDSIPQKELQQNVADQQSAQAAYEAARKTLKLFGLSDADVARIEHDHRVDVEMPVRSPFAGRVTARAAQAGAIVQPAVAQAGAPAPVTVSDVRTLWMVASVPESDFARYRLGQPVAVRVQAWPGKTFAGKVSYLGDAVDPATHRITVRADVDDKAHQLRPQMLADFDITLAAPETSVGVPATAVVRETDGSSAVWVAAADVEGPTFMRRRVSTGHSDQGMVQITAGLQPGERFVRRNALFLSNLYEAGAD